MSTGGSERGWASERGAETLGGRVMAILHPILVVHHLAVELVHQLVDDGVHISAGALDEDVAPLHTEGDFGVVPAFLLPLLLDREPHGDVHDLTEVPERPLELREHVLAQGRRDFEVVSADRQVHIRPPWRVAA